MIRSPYWTGGKSGTRDKARWWGEGERRREKPFSFSFSLSLPFVPDFLSLQFVSVTYAFGA